MSPPQTVSTVPMSLTLGAKSDSQLISLIFPKRLKDLAHVVDREVSAQRLIGRTDENAADADESHKRFVKRLFLQRFTCKTSFFSRPKSFNAETIKAIGEARNAVEDFLREHGFYTSPKQVVFAQTQDRYFQGVARLGIRAVGISDMLISQGSYQAQFLTAAHELIHALGPIWLSCRALSSSTKSRNKQKLVRHGAIYRRNPKCRSSRGRFLSRFAIVEELIAVQFERYLMGQTQFPVKTNQSGYIFLLKKYIRRTSKTCYEAMCRDSKLLPPLRRRIKEVFLPNRNGFFSFWTRVKNVFDPFILTSFGGATAGLIDEKGGVHVSYPHVQFLSQVLSEKLFPELTGQERDFALMKYLLKTLWSDSPRQFYRDVATHFGRDAVRFLAFADVFDDIQTLMYFKPEAFGIVDEKAQRRLRRSLIAEYERKNRSIK